MTRSPVFAPVAQIVRNGVKRIARDARVRGASHLGEPPLVAVAHVGLDHEDVRLVGVEKLDHLHDREEPRDRGECDLDY